MTDTGLISMPEMPEFLDRRPTAVRSVRLLDIKVDQRAQPRDHLNSEIVEQYAQDMAAGSQFPPMVVFFDGESYWLADGFHRHYAARGAEIEAFPCEVRKGGLRDAILYSVGANATHGYPRSNADKRRAVMRLLDDAEWSQWSDREIARQCSVGHQMVAPLRESLTGRATSERAYTTKHGTVAKMDTAKIGGTRERAPNADAPIMDGGDPTAPKWSIESVPANVRADLERDNANSWIPKLIWHIEEEAGKLPEPSDAARRFSKTLHHTFPGVEAARAEGGPWRCCRERWQRQGSGVPVRARSSICLMLPSLSSVSQWSRSSCRP